MTCNFQSVIVLITEANVTGNDTCGRFGVKPFCPYTAYTGLEKERKLIKLPEVTIQEYNGTVIHSVTMTNNDYDVDDNYFRHAFSLLH